jgi:hypothetical protein
MQPASADWAQMRNEIRRANHSRGMIAPASNPASGFIESEEVTEKPALFF